MITALWVVLGVLLVSIVALSLVVAGVVRSMEEIRRQLGSRGTLGEYSDSGALTIGASPPPFEATLITGGGITSSSFAGETHVIVFAHPGCRPCEELLPEVILAGEKGDLPPTIIISQGAADEHSSSWQTAERETGGIVRVALDSERRISEMFGVSMSPYIYVVNPEGRVGARGVANDAAAIKEALRQATIASPAQTFVGAPTAIRRGQP